MKARPYHPGALIKASFVLHAGGLVLVLLRPESWPWLLLMLVLNHLVLTALGLWPKSTGLGPNFNKMGAHTPAAVFLTFDDGPDPLTTPWVLDLLDRYGMKATFFVIGRRVLEYPEIVADIVERGHAIGNHSMEHRVGFALQGVGGFEAELSKAQAVIEKVTGVRPYYFRAPFGFRSPLLEPALCRIGLHLVSWTRRGFDTRCKDKEKILKRLLQGLENGDILLLHDGSHQEDATASPMVREVLPCLLEVMKHRGFRSLALYPWGKAL